MPRFKVNRWWILILALCLGFASVALTTTHATAGPRMIDLGQRDGTAVPPLYGDPDIPVSSMKRERAGAAGQPAAITASRRAAGDGASAGSVMMWHFRVVLQSLGLWPFGRF